MNVLCAAIVKSDIFSPPMRAVLPWKLNPRMGFGGHRSSLRPQHMVRTVIENLKLGCSTEKEACNMNIGCGIEKEACNVKIGSNTEKETCPCWESS